MFQTKTDKEMTGAERLERIIERRDINAQIRADQAADAKRDKKALAKERAWLKRNGIK